MKHVDNDRNCINFLFRDFAATVSQCFALLSVFPLNRFQKCLCIYEATENEESWEENKVLLIA